MQQKLKNEKNLISAKKSNVEKLFEELESKEAELRNLHVLNEKSTRMHMINDSKIQKEILALRKSLYNERNLKLDAFQRVDDLQSQLYDIEDEISHVITHTRPQTSVGNTKPSKLYNINIDIYIQIYFKCYIKKKASAKVISALSNKYASPFPRLNGFTSNIFDNNTSANLLPIARPKSVRFLYYYYYYYSCSYLKNMLNLKNIT